MKKGNLIMDERNKQIAYKVIAIMYFLTVFAIAGVIIYRQFVLRQELSNYEDIAIILTINSLFLMSALLYFGAIPIRRLKVKSILIIYAVLVVAGSIFTYIYYNIVQSPGLSFKELINKFLIIVAITGIIMGFWVLLSILGKKRLDKELE
jgi:magnesium-transporting ATPase (P-type)